MKTSKALEVLYSSYKELQGEHEARKTVAALLSCTIFDLQQEKLSISAKKLDTRLSEQMETIVKGSKAGAL